MTSSTPSLADKLATLQAAKNTNDAAAANRSAQVANQEAAAAKIPEATERIFFGELPPAVSYLTKTGQPVFFYQGYHKTTDPEVVEICQAIPGVTEITGQISPEEVPVPPVRSRARNWAAGTDPTVVSPAELLGLAAARRVQSTADTPQAATSNSTV